MNRSISHSNKSYYREERIGRCDIATQLGEGILWIEHPKKGMYSKGLNEKKEPFLQNTRAEHFHAKGQHR